MRSIISYLSIFLDKSHFPSRDDAQEKLAWFAQKVRMDLRNLDLKGEFDAARDQEAWGPFFLHGDEEGEREAEMGEYLGTFVLDGSEPEWFTGLLPEREGAYLVSDFLASVVAPPSESVPMCLGTWHRVNSPEEEASHLAAVDHRLMVVLPGAVIQETLMEAAAGLIHEAGVSSRAVMQAARIEPGILYASLGKVRTLNRLPGLRDVIDDLLPPLGEGAEGA